MPAVPQTHTFTDGVVTSSEDNSHLRDPIAFLTSPPIAELRRTTAQSLTSGVLTAIGMDTPDVDTDVDGIGGHDPVTNNSRYTARYPGWYSVGVGVGYVANATGIRTAQSAVNGSNVNGSQGKINAVTGGVATCVVGRTKLVYLNEGDYAEPMGFQNSGGALNTSTTDVEQPNMSIRFVSI